MRENRRRSSTDAKVAATSSPRPRLARKHCSAPLAGPSPRCRNGLPRQVQWGQPSGEGECPGYLRRYLTPGVIILYAVPNKYLKSGLENVRHPVSVAVSSRQVIVGEQEYVPDAIRFEKRVRLDYVPGLGLCGRLPFERRRQYELRFYADLKDPKREDPQAKSYGIDQYAQLDSVTRAPAVVRNVLGAKCGLRLRSAPS